jgi:ABC-type branched-subunit amino acid transport system ATPase component
MDHVTEQPARVEGATTPAAAEILRTDALSKSFGGVSALDRVSIRVRAGGITGIIGPNGSGKSTFFDVITGIVKRDAGHIWFNGREMDKPSLENCTRRGLVRTFQVPRVAASMTVLEHFMLAPPAGAGESLMQLMAAWRLRRIAADERNRLANARAMSETLGLQAVQNSRASSLSGGQLKLLSVGVALMLKPRLLLLDEPVAGVNTSMIEVVMSLLRKACGEGTTVLIIEHNMSVMWELCESVYVMHEGRVIASGSAEEMKHNHLVIDAYLGRSA